MSRKVKDKIRNKYKTNPFKYNLQTYFTSDTISTCKIIQIVRVITIKSQKY